METSAFFVDLVGPKVFMLVGRFHEERDARAAYQTCRYNLVDRSKFSGAKLVKVTYLDGVPQDSAVLAQNTWG